MRVVWVCAYPLNGIENIPVRVRKHKAHPVSWVVGLAKMVGKVRDDVELHIVIPSQFVYKSFECEGFGITFHVVRLAIPFTRRGWPPYFPLHLWSRYFFTRKKLQRVIRTIDPDIVHAHGTEFSHGWVAYDSKCPSVLSIQGMMHYLVKENDFSLMDGALRVKSEKFVVEHTKYFIAKTPYARRFIEEMNPRAQIFKLENMMRPDFFNMTKDYSKTNRVLFIGPFVQYKGVDELFAALSVLPHITLVVIGTRPPLNKKAQELVDKYPSVKVDWKGHLSGSEVAEQMASVDMLVHPARSDNSPNVVSEAMCLGLPVVATRVGGIPDMIRDNDTGILIPSCDVEKLSLAIRLLMDDKSKRKALGTAARADALKRFHPDVAVNGLVEVYESILQEESIS